MLERRRKPLIILGSALLVLLLSPFIAGAIYALIGVAAYYDYAGTRKHALKLWTELDLFGEWKPEEDEDKKVINFKDKK